MSKADWLASWLGEKSKLGKVTAKKMFRGDAEKEGLLVIPIMRRPLRTWLAASRQAAFWATALDLRRDRRGQAGALVSLQTDRITRVASNSHRSTSLGFGGLG